MRIKNYKQFNESYQTDTNLELNSSEMYKIKENIYNNLDSMSEIQKDSIFQELENMSHKLNCTIEDLSNPSFVKEHIDQITKSNDVIEEGFFTDMKYKIFKFLSKIFGWGGPIGSLIMIVISSLNANFWGVFTGAISFTISVLASAYLSHLGEKYKNK